MPQRALLVGQLDVHRGLSRRLGRPARPAGSSAPADEPDQVLDQRGVAVQRVGDVHAQCRRAGGGRSAAPGGPCRPASTRHGEVVAGVQPGVQPPAARTAGQVQGARGDVDVGDLLGHRLERGQRPAELLPGPDVRRWSGRARRPAAPSARQHAPASASRYEVRHVAAVQPGAEQMRDRRLGPAAACTRARRPNSACAPRVTPGAAGSTSTTPVPPAAEAGRHQDPARRRGVRHADLDPGHGAQPGAVARPAWRWWRAPAASAPTAPGWPR